MKIAKISWITGSILINIVIGFYINLMSKSPTGPEETFNYINENWSAFSGMWKIEFVLMILIAFSAFYFALYFKNISWSIITTGQFIILLTYPIMLGGYHNSSVKMFLMTNEMATVVFLVGNIFFFVGLIVLYLNDSLLSKWLKIAAILFATIGTISMTGCFIGLYPWKEAMVVGPIISLLYLINAYYVFLLKPITNS